MRLLAAHCAAGSRIPAMHPHAAQLLLTYAWPGNVRELENVMQRALVLCDGDLVRDSHIVFEPPAAAPVAGAPPVAVAATPAPASGSDPEASPGALAESLALAEQRIILEALRSNETRERVAERLGISPRTLRYKLARLRAPASTATNWPSVGGSAS